MLDKVTHPMFAACLGSKFRVFPDPDRVLEFDLVEVTALPVHPARDGQRSRREPFSLLFRGPKQVLLPQRIYPIEHEKLGRLEVFLVPLGPDQEGMRYEAIFN